MAFFGPFVVEEDPFRGRPPGSHRRVLDAIFWVARMGIPWRGLPPELGNWNSVHRQYRRWTTSGLFRCAAVGTGGWGLVRNFV
ncbi:transposase [Teichococcus wenyumeiae]